MTKLSKTVTAVILTAGLMGCSLPLPGNSGNPSGGDSASSANSDDMVYIGVEDDSVPADDLKIGELKELEFDYWDVDNSNGIPYFFAKVYNPNDVAVDFSVKIDYCAGDDKAEAGEMDDLMSSVGPKQTIILSDLSGRAFPDTDNITVSYDYLNESGYASVDAKVTKNETSDDGLSHHIEVSISDEDFYFCDLKVLYYLEGEVTGFDFASFYPGDDYSYDSSCVFNYDNYEVFVSAFRIKL